MPFCLLMLMPAAAVQAQDTTASEPALLPDVVVTARRRGSTATMPERELDGGAIDALGGAKISDVLAKLKRANGDGDEIAVIINGRRITDPLVFLQLPPDALDRLEILPPGSAATYGGDATGRTYNLVVAESYRSSEVETAAAMPTRGGSTRLEATVRRNAVEGLKLSSTQIGANRETALYGRERPGFLTDPASDGATLRPATESVNAQLSLNIPVGDWNVSLNTNAQRDDSRSVSATGSTDVTNRSLVDSASVNATFGGQVQDWFVNVFGGGQWSESDQSGLVDSRQTVTALNAAASASGRIDGLPAGASQINLSAGVNQSRSRSVQESDRTNQTINARNVRARAVIPLFRSGPDSNTTLPIGTVSANVGAGWDDASTGGGTSSNIGLNWAVRPRLRMVVNLARSQVQPNTDQLTKPLTIGPPVLVYDFRTAGAVEVTPLLGGNPDLRPSQSDVLYTNVSAGPFSPWTFQASTGLTVQSSRDGIVNGLPPTPANEAAFPERFVRDADGRLTRIDQRPLNLAQTRSSTLSSNVSFEVPKVSGLRVSARHTLRLKDEIRFGAGSQVQDRLAGDGGGSAPQSLFLQLSYGAERWSGNFEVQHDRAYRMRRDIGVDGPDDVIANANTRVDLEVNYKFVRDLKSQGEASEIRRGDGLKLAFSIKNLFDARGDAHLGDGRPAPQYRTAGEDPAGRVVRLSLVQRF